MPSSSSPVKSTFNPGGKKIDADRGAFIPPKEVSELLYSPPRWPESVPLRIHKAPPGRPGSLGGKNVPWAPKPVPTEADIRNMIMKGKHGTDNHHHPSSPTATTATSPKHAHHNNVSRFPAWLRERSDFQSVMAFTTGLTSSSSESKTMETEQITEELQLIEACNQTCGHRNSHECLAITKILRKLHYCSSFDNITLEAISQKVTYHTFTQDTVICEQGAPGDHFYILLDGTVNVEVRGLGIVAKLSKGNTFGELALSCAECRQATVRVHSKEVSCLVLERADYQEILGPARHAWMGSTVEFLAKLPLFAKWSRNRLQRLVMVLSTEYVDSGTEIVQQGILADRLLFIEKGHLEMVHYSEVFGENRWPVSKEEAEQSKIPTDPFLSSPSSPTHNESLPRYSSRSSSPPRSPRRPPSLTVDTLPSGRRLPSPLHPRHGYGTGSGGTLAYSPRSPSRSRRGTDPEEGFHTSTSSTTAIDTSGHFAMGLRRTKLVSCEPIGEVKSGACYGLSVIARAEAHPFSLVTTAPTTLLYISAKYLRPNALAGYDIVATQRKVNRRGNYFGLGDDTMSPNPISSPTAGNNGSNASTTPGSVALRQRQRSSSVILSSPSSPGVSKPGNTTSGSIPDVPPSRFTQIIKRTSAKPQVAHISLAPPAITPKKGEKSGFGQDELGVVFPTMKSPAKTANFLTQGNVQEVLSHVVDTQSQAADVDSEDHAVQTLLASLSDNCVHIYPGASEHLRNINMASKHGILSKRLASARRASLSVLVPIENADCEKILRRMMTRLDDDIRAIQAEHEEWKKQEEDNRLHLYTNIDDDDDTEEEFTGNEGEPPESTQN